MVSGISVWCCIDELKIWGPIQRRIKHVLCLQSYSEIVCVWKHIMNCELILLTSTQCFRFALSLFLIYYNSWSFMVIWLQVICCWGLWNGPFVFGQLVCTCLGHQVSVTKACHTQFARSYIKWSSSSTKPLLLCISNLIRRLPQCGISVLAS